MRATGATVPATLRMRWVWAWAIGNSETQLKSCNFPTVDFNKQFYYKSHSMNSEPPPEPFILRLPNEVLHQIFAHLYALSLHDPARSILSNGQEQELGQMLVLPSICRRFRAITPELDFWIHPRFSS